MRTEDGGTFSALLLLLLLSSWECWVDWERWEDWPVLHPGGGGVGTDGDGNVVFRDP